MECANGIEIAECRQFSECPYFSILESRCMFETFPERPRYVQSPGEESFLNERKAGELII